MRIIEARMVYTYNGKDYSTSEKARQAWEDEVGAFVDTITNNGSFAPDQRIHLHTMLVASAPEASKLLDLRMEEDN